MIISLKTRCDYEDQNLLLLPPARTSETSIDIQLTTRQYIPEDSELQTCFNL
jgi:hypothetical protein